jgi:hypothetical protein
MKDIVERLHAAINDHDIDALVACFEDEYVNETPVHPARSFVGAAQVRANWTQIFGGLPDIQATLVRRVAQDDTTWAEWEMAGTRHDGSAHVLRGVTILGGGDRAAWARFYLEPVDEDHAGVGEHLTRTVGR